MSRFKVRADEATKRTSFLVPMEDWLAVYAIATARMASVSDIVAEAVKEYVERQREGESLKTGT